MLIITSFSFLVFSCSYCFLLDDEIVVDFFFVHPYTVSYAVYTMMQSKTTVAVAMATVLRKEAGKLYTIVRLGKIMKHVKNL